MHSIAFRFTKPFVLLFACLVVLTGAPVMAAGTTVMQVSNKAPAVGDTIKVGVTGSQSAKITIAYDNSIITLIGNSVDGTTASNSFTFTGKSIDLTFKAKAPGTTGISVSSDSLTGSSVNIQVTGQAAASDDTNNDEATPETDETPEAEAAESNVNENNEIVELAGSASTYRVTIMEPETIPTTQLIAIVCETEEGHFNAYQIEGGDENLYYIYGSLPDVAPEWFCYDATTGVLSRVDEMLLEGLSQEGADNLVPASESSPTFLQRLMTDKRLLIAIAVFIVALIIVIIINVVLHKRIKNMDDEDYDDDDYDDDDDEFFSEKYTKSHTIEKDVPKAPVTDDSTSQTVETVPDASQGTNATQSQPAQVTQTTQDTPTKQSEQATVSQEAPVEPISASATSEELPQENKASQTTDAPQTSDAPQTQAANKQEESIDDLYKSIEIEIIDFDDF